MITGKQKQELLKNPSVIEEINKHKWFESQKTGSDVGFEFAAEDWLNKHANSWLAKSSKSAKKEDEKPSVFGKKRSAKTYL
jgi:hypothetical protein